MASLVPVKDPVTLLRAFARVAPVLPRASLNVVGFLVSAVTMLVTAAIATFWVRSALPLTVLALMGGAA